MRLYIFLILILIPNVLISQKLPDLIPFVKQNKWGYCDSTMKIIIEPQFESAEPFVNGKALIGLTNSDGLNLIDIKGKKIETTYIISDQSESGNYNITDHDGNAGLMNQNLQVIVKPEYNGITELHGSFIGVSKMNKSGIFNVQTKKWALPLMENNFSEHIFGPFYGMMNEEMGYSSIYNASISKNIITDITYAYVLNDSHAAILFSDGMNGVMDQKGNILFKTKSRLCYPANENRIGFTSNETKYGYMDFHGKTVIEPQFDFVFNFKNNRAVVTLENKSGVIDSLGNWIIQPEYAILNPWFNDFSEKVLPLNKGDSTYFFDINGKIINKIEKVNSYSNFENQILSVGTNGKNYAFINQKGNFITAYKFSGPAKFKNGIAKVSIKNPDNTLTFFYIDKYGNEYIFKD